MRGVHFRTFLRMALLAARAPRLAEVPPIIVVDPNAAWAYSVDGMEFHGWRTLDGSALVAAPTARPVS